MTEEDSKKELRFTIEPGKNSNIERVEVFLNGTLKNTFYNSDKSDKPENYPTFSYETDIRIPIITSQNWSSEQTNINSIPLLAGYNRIKIVAYDVDKNIIPESNSLSIVFKISDPLKIPKGDLHILAIGVNEYENVSFVFLFFILWINISSTNSSISFISVGKIKIDQVEDFAERKNMTKELAERWLSPNLA